MRIVIAILALMAVKCNAEAAGPDNADLGNWKVGNCIIAQFAMEFTVFNITNKSDITTIDVPRTAKVNGDQSNCEGNGQILNLIWQEPMANDTSVMLWRNVTVDFRKKANESYYGVHRFFANFEVAKFVYNGTNSTMNVTSSFKIDSQEKERLMFLTPLDRSFLCADINTLHLPTSFSFSIPNTASRKWNDTLVTAKHVQFDAFRPADHVPSGFRTPMDCDYQPNDIIPIAVGVALAALVVAVLIAYLIGRRRHRQRGYQSV